MESTKVLAVIVTYFPDREKLVALVRSLIDQVDACVIVDNTDKYVDAVYSYLSADLSCEEFGKLRIARLGENAGIAVALNLGVSICLQEEFDYLYLSDQDSLPPPGMVSNLRGAMEHLADTGVKVGAVGPQYYDAITDQVFPFQVQPKGRVFYSNKMPAPGDGCIETILLITSGSLVSREALLEVGFHFDELFIDNVDMEWCFRAQSLGFHLFGVATTRLHHFLGDDVKSIWFFGWRETSLYSHTRVYYRIRNFIYLTKLPWIPLNWKVKAARYYLAMIYTHLVWGSERYKYARSIMRGISHGIRNVLGRYPDNLAKVSKPSISQFRRVTVSNKTPGRDVAG